MRTAVKSKRRATKKQSPPKSRREIAEEMPRSWVRAFAHLASGHYLIVDKRYGHGASLTHGVCAATLRALLGRGMIEVQRDTEEFTAYRFSAKGRKKWLGR